MNNSKIEWTDKTWNPVTGCTKVSQGCKHCYAEKFYERFHGHGSFRQVNCHQDRLTIPARWTKPALVFVNSMSDLFHEAVPFEFISAVFSVMSDVSRHTYQVLTKRPERMLEFYRWKWEHHGISWQPSDNVWIGVSVEDQQTAEQRIPVLMVCPARVRFLSCEPLLGPIDLQRVKAPPVSMEQSLGLSKRPYLDCVTPWHQDIGESIHARVDWVIVGGESGHPARPMHPEWARQLRDQCNAGGVPFFFKQWGQYAMGWMISALHPAAPHTSTSAEYLALQEAIKCRHKCIALDGEIIWAGQSIEGCTYPIAVMSSVGKHAAGRILDDRLHNDFPSYHPAIASPHFS